MRAHSLVLVGGLVAATALGGCATMSSVKGPPMGGTVHMYKQGSGGDHANCYWIETPQGAVVVDVPLSITETKRMKGLMDRPYRIYITAAHPERFGGLDVMRQPGDVPAFTTPAVATEIQNHGDTRLAPLHREFGQDVPRHVNAPTPAVEERTQDMIGDDLEIDTLPLGPAESDASLALYLPKTGERIAGDVVAGGDHVDLTWGRSVVWQDRINELKALNPKLVYPGHGTPGGPELLDQTLAYLKYFHDAVAEKVKPGAPARISKADLAAIRQKMLLQYPKLGRPELLDKSIPAEYAVQLAALPPAPATPAAPGAPGQAPPAGAPAASPSAATAPPASSNSVDDLLNAGKK